MSEEKPDDNSQSTDRLHMVVSVVSAYLGNNSIAAKEVPDLIRSVASALTDLTGADGQMAHGTQQKPAVPIKKSITDDHIICLEDGRKLKMLKRYLRTRYDMTPEEYRSKWGLPPEYPMVAPNYAAQRSNFAKQIGLGRVKNNKDDS